MGYVNPLEGKLLSNIMAIGHEIHPLFSIGKIYTNSYKFKMYCKCRLTYIGSNGYGSKFGCQRDRRRWNHNFDLRHSKNECHVPDGKYVKKIQYHAKNNTFSWMTLIFIKVVFFDTINL